MQRQLPRHRKKNKLISRYCSKQNVNVKLQERQVCQSCRHCNHSVKMVQNKAWIPVTGKGITINRARVPVIGKGITPSWTEV